MKFTYEIEQESALDKETIYNNIISKLTEYDYTIIEKANNIIVFSLDGWGWNGKQLDKVSGGEFQILISDGNILIKLKYYLSVVYPVASSLVFLLSFFLFGLPFLFLSIVLVLISIAGFYASKSKSKEMLVQIAGVDNL